MERFSGEWQWLTLADLACSSIKLIKGRGNKGLKCQTERGHLFGSIQIQALSTEKTKWQTASKNCQLTICDWNEIPKAAHNLCGHCTKEHPNIQAFFECSNHWDFKITWREVRTVFRKEIFLLFVSSLKNI